MPNPRLASRYAKSLLDISIEQSSLEAALKDIQLLDAICRQSRDFELMLRSPVIKGDKKQRIIESVAGDSLSPLTKAFLALMVSKGREGYLPEIASAFIAQYKAMKNIKSVLLTTATPVSDHVKEAIRQKIASNMPEMKIEMKTGVDPDLIGGFVLEMEDKLFDASIRKDLNDVKSQFLKNVYVSELR